MTVLLAIGYRIVAGTTKWMASSKSFHGKPAALDGSMDLNSLDGIAGAGWLESAVHSYQRAQCRLVDANEADADHGGKRIPSSLGSAHAASLPRGLPDCLCEHCTVPLRGKWLMSSHRDDQIVSLGLGVGH